MQQKTGCNDLLFNQHTRSKFAICPHFVQGEIDYGI